jgi:hypothetical protein
MHTGLYGNQQNIAKSWGDTLLFTAELSSFPQFLWANSPVTGADFLKIS